MSMICVCGVLCAWVVTGGGVRWRDGRTLFSLGPRLVTSRYIVATSSRPRRHWAESALTRRTDMFWEY